MCFSIGKSFLLCLGTDSQGAAAGLLHLVRGHPVLPGRRRPLLKRAGLPQVLGHCCLCGGLCSHLCTALLLQVVAFPAAAQSGHCWSPSMRMRIAEYGRKKITCCPASTNSADTQRLAAAGGCATGAHSSKVFSRSAARKGPSLSTGGGPGAGGDNTGAPDAKRRRLQRGAAETARMEVQLHGDGGDADEELEDF